MKLNTMQRLAAHPCDACKRGDHDACDNEEANAGATYSEDFIVVCVCAVCDSQDPCHEWAFDDEARERYCIHCGVTDTDPSTAIRFATCPAAAGYPLAQKGSEK